MGTVQSILTIAVLQGLLYAFISISSAITFRFLAFPDLTPEGSFPLGASVAAAMIVGGSSPWVATAAGVGAGAAAGLATGLLATKLRINGILAGILTLTAIITVDLRVMGRPNVAILTEPTVLTDTFGALRLDGGDYSTIGVLAVLVGVTVLGLTWLFHTDLGLAMRATGDNPQMIRAFGVDTDKSLLAGLVLANGLVGLSGALVAQWQGFADFGMGVGTIVSAFAGLIVGETLFGRRGVAHLLVAVVAGVVVYRIILTTALYLGLESTDLKLVSAVLVALVLGLPVLRSRLLPAHA